MSSTGNTGSQMSDQERDFSHGNTTHTKRTQPKQQYKRTNEFQTTLVNALQSRYTVNTANCQPTTSENMFAFMVSKSLAFG